MPCNWFMSLIDFFVFKFDSLEFICVANILGEHGPLNPPFRSRHALGAAKERGKDSFSVAQALQLPSN